MEFASNVTTAAIINGTPGATISISIEGHLLPDREVARVTVPDDGIASVTFTVAWEEFILARAQARYVVDGVLSGAALPLWSQAFAGLPSPL